MKHEVKIVRLGAVSRHENADALGVTVIDGYLVVIRLGEWAEGDLGVYIEPDYIVPEAPWSAFLGTHRRIKVKRLRGVYSQGLLLPLSVMGDACHDGSLGEGVDVMERLGIVRYEPPEDGQPGFKATSGETPHPTLAGLSKYDLESWQKYQRFMAPGSWVIVTEKIHGENARFAWRDGRMWAGSRGRWVAPDEANAAWWLALRDNPWIEEWCRENPDAVLYGEVFGNVPKMRYGVPEGQRGFRIFDVLGPDRKWWDPSIVLAIMPEARHVPLLYSGPIEGCDPRVLAEGKSTLADHVREGCVIKPARDVWDQRIGRLAFKCVGNGYLEKADA